MLKYKPLRKYLVSSFEIANLVLSISFKKTFDPIFILIPSVFCSIIGKSSLGRLDRENLEPLALRVRIFPSFESTSTSLSSSNFLTMSYKI